MKRKQSRSRLAAPAAQPTAKRSRSRGTAPDARALVVDPERLLAALEAGEHLLDAPKPEPLAPVAAMAPVEAMQATVVEPPAESGPVLETKHVEAIPVPLPLRPNESLETTHSGVLVIRRRRAA